MKLKHKIIVFSILGAGVFAGGGFPTLLAGIQDYQIEKREEQLTSDTVRLNMDSELSISDKLMGINNYGSFVQLDSAQTMTYETAKNKVNSDLEEISQIFDLVPGGGELEIQEHAILLYMLEGEHSGSMIVWKFTLKDDSGRSMEVYMDDESGCIIKIAGMPDYEENMPSDRYLKNESSVVTGIYNDPYLGMGKFEEYIGQYYDCQVIERYPEDTDSFSVQLLDTDGYFAEIRIVAYGTYFSLN